MTTITDTSILNWLPFDETGGEAWRLALVNSENQNWNVTDPSNSTTTLAMAAAARHGNNSSLFTSPAHLGLATGLLLSLLLNSRIWTTKANREVFGTKSIFGTPKPYQWILHLTPSSSFTFASTKTFILPYLYLLPLLAIILLLPILSILMAFLLPFAIYRTVVKKYLQYRSNSRLEKKLFSGADAVWTFNESYESYSVINALVVLEGVPQIDKLRHLLTVRLGSIPKLRMRHDFSLGYATWYEDKEMDFGSLVQWIPGFSGNVHCGSWAKESSVKLPGDEHQSNSKWNRKNLSEIVESLCNRPLPMNHSVGWEALVGKAMPWDDSENDLNTESTKDKCNQESTKDKTASQTVFPILFRIHHSVGDGASLLQLLMSALIDGERDNSSPTINSPDLKHPTAISRPLTLNISPFEMDKPKLQSYINKQEFKGENATNAKPVDNLNRSSGAKHAHLHTQSHTTEPKISYTSESEKESSFLYGRRLSGRKTILWDSTSVSVEEIKKIRGATGVKFTEILLSAVSSALSNYWEAREKGQLKDVPCPNKNAMQKKEVRQHGNEISSHETESEDDWDRLTDAPEENEGETSEKENSSPIQCDKQGTPPPSVKLVLPAIIGSIFQKQKDLTLKDTSELENLFSVAVMTLPVGKSGGCPLQRLSKVTDASGYMMPLRKDSFVDCGMKMKLEKEAFNKRATENTEEIEKCAPITFQEVKNISPTSEVTQPNTKSQEITLSTVHNETVKVNLNASSIPPRAPEVLTYYYTKQPEVQFKLAPEPEAKTDRSAQVHYHRYTESAKVILHEKEPYHCPTTIFFSQNSSNTQSQDVAKSQINVKKRDQDNITKCSDNAHFDAVKPLENIVEANKMADINSAIPKPAEIQEVPKNKAESKPFINFPSSPTIQHLLTRWLALDIVATVLPSIFAAPMMKVAAKDVAVVMSNLPGPPQKLKSILGGHALKDIVFWAPHRGYTGLGITVLSYDGLLHIGVMADDAVIPTQKGAQLIMNTILDELHSLRAAVSSSH